MYTYPCIYIYVYDLLLQAHSKEEWRHCILCRTKIQAADSLKRAQTRSVSWPAKPREQRPPIRDLSSCTINEAIGTMVQYLNTSTRHCKVFLVKI